mgnify:CR=1 FL=1
MTDRNMKILATSDTHWGEYEDADRATLDLADHVAASDADVFALVGDVAGTELDDFEACLRAFSGFSGVKLVVPGNHDLWTNGEDSFTRYTEELPRLAEECGFHMLDQGPVVTDGTAFVGSMGWYDYSFRDPSLDMTTEDYRQKTVPGGMTWNDVRFVHWDMTDEDVTEMCVERLEQHYREVQGRADRVVAIIHHVPFEDLLYDETDEPAWQFCRAYLGARRLGQTIEQWSELCAVISGHRHKWATCRRDGLRAFVVGSGSDAKRMLQLDPVTGEYDTLEFPAHI